MGNVNVPKLFSQNNLQVSHFKRIFCSPKPPQAYENIRHRGGYPRGSHVCRNPRWLGPFEVTLVGVQLRNSFENGIGLRQNCVFKDRLVGDKGIHGADALHRSVELVE